ncbi:Rpn family recombination-promoting nuclease/putative transposase [Bacillus tianshenii]|nr:Rpn family recombination-promoting nuclease/putative transposase [Bacillus tianshenii]
MKIETSWHKKGREEGRQEGIQEGRQEGLREVKKEVARKMLQEGFAVEQIMKITDLSEEEVAKLKGE